MGNKSSTWSEKQRIREDIIDAVIRGKRLEVESMLNEEADPNDSEGGYLTRKTLLILAIENNHVEIANLLVKRGADLQASIMVNKEKKTVVDLAQEKQLDSLVALIENTKATNEDDDEYIAVPLLLYALCEDHMDVAKILIMAGANLDYVVKWTDPSSGEYTEDSARSYAKRMHFTDIVELIDRETERRKRVQANGHAIENVKCDGDRPTNKRQQPLNVELEDIEDEDFVELERNTAQPHSPRRNKRSKNV